MFLMNIMPLLVLLPASGQGRRHDQPTIRYVPFYINPGFAEPRCCCVDDRLACF
jgi:hypothetical protein